MATPHSPSNLAEGPVDRAFHLLQVVVAADSPIGVRELGRRTGLPRSTASRLVATLERLRMVDRTPDGDVIAGSALATLQTGRTTTPMLRDRLHPLLVELVQRFGENAAVAVDDGESLLYISNVAVENPVSVADVSGDRHPFHLVAPGLVAMSRWPSQRLDAYLDHPLEAATEYSMTEPDQLRKRVEAIAKDGHAWTDQELDVGVNGLAVPVTIPSDIAATVSLYGPTYRFSPTTAPELAQELKAIVNERVA